MRTSGPMKRHRGTVTLFDENVLVTRRRVPVRTPQKNVAGADMAGHADPTAGTDRDGENWCREGMKVVPKLKLCIYFRIFIAGNLVVKQKKLIFAKSWEGGG